MTKNQKLLAYIGLFVVFMIGMSFAAVPAYRMFCQVTGWDGTPNILKEAATPDDAREREVLVQFTSRVNDDLAWSFKPLQKKINVQVGVSNLVGYKGKNEGSGVSTGTAVYNVTPAKAAKYFNKTQCFCFARQTLAPGQSENFPIEFYIDPEFTEDEEMQDVKIITLSYVFYPADSSQLDEAIEAGYNPVTN